MFRSSMKYVGSILTIEECIEVQCITVQNRCFIHLMLHYQIDLFQLFYCASLEIKLSFVRLIRQTLAGIIRVQNWLLELFDECLVV